MTDHTTDHTTDTEKRTSEQRLVDMMLTAMSIHLDIHGQLRADAPTNQKEATAMLWLIGCMDACTCLMKAADKGLDAGVGQFHEMRAELADKIDVFLQSEE